MDITSLVIWIFFIALVIYATYGTAKEYQKMHAVTADPIYLKFGVTKENIKLYQHFVNKITSLGSVKNARFAENISNKDYKLIDKVLGEAEGEGLSNNALTIMYMQWVYADEQERYMYSNEWVKRVLKRSPRDFFPDSMTIYNSISKS